MRKHFASNMKQENRTMNKILLAIALIIPSVCFSGTHIQNGDPATIPSVTVTNLAGGGTQCLQTNNSGEVTGTGSACGSGGGGGGASGLINPSAQYNVPYYSASGSTTTLSGSSAFTYNGTTVTVLGPVIASSGISSGNGLSTGYWESLSGVSPGNPPSNNYRIYFDSANSNNLTSRDASGVTKVYASTASNVATATALAANGSNCSAGQAPLGVDASGNAEGCFTPSGGGGGFSPGIYADCFLATNCAPPPMINRATVISTTTLRMQRFTVAGASVPLKTAVLYTGSGGVSESIAFAIYDDSSGSPGSKVTNTEVRFTNLSAAGLATTTWGSGTVILTPGVYWLGYQTESTTALFLNTDAGYGGHNYFLGHIPTKPGNVVCTNSATGTGGSYALPSSCTSPSAITTYQPQMPLVMSSAY